MTYSDGPIFEVEKAKAVIEKGRRSAWWQRRGAGSVRTFQYFDSSGTQIKNAADIERIHSLVIPPAWQMVRINPSPGGKIQVVGMDASGRVQYRYHPVFSGKQQRKKFAKVVEFGKHLPELRRITNEHITLEGLPREKVLAVVLRLINSLYFRVGSELSVEHYKTYGITTLQKRHLTIGQRGKLSFEFVGKSHVQHRKIIVDEGLSSVIKELVTIGRGRKLFRYIDVDGRPHPITPSQINAYIKSATGSQFSSKDFRTWGGSVLAAAKLAEIGAAQTEAEIKKNITSVVKQVAEELGNTPAVCRSSYIHPAVLDAYVSGTTIDEFLPKRAVQKSVPDLEPEEKALLRLFESAAK